MSSRKRKCKCKRFQVESLEQRTLLAFDSLVITEFMAANDAGLVDEDGDFSDWIEIHNPTNEAVTLDGWSLTDNADELSRWGFPNRSLAPGEYALVFASGKDRTPTEGELHTNFRLDKDGEYLAIVDPAGEAVHAFGAAYPKQSGDVSYGLSVSQTSLLNETSSGNYRVPSSSEAAIGTTWTSPEFDDAAWNEATVSIGYDQRSGFPNVGFEAGDFSDWSTSGETSIVNVSFGVTPSDGLQQALMVANEVSTTRFSLETFLGLSRARLNEVESGVATRGSAIRRVFDVEVGDVLEFDWDFLTSEPNTNGRDDFAFLSVSPGDTVIKLGGVSDATQISPTSFNSETGVQRFEHTFTEAGEVTIGFGVAQVDGPFLESALLIDDVKLNGFGALEETFTSVVTTDVADAFAGDQAASLWTRYTFDVPNIDMFNSLLLPIQYDDGFIAYLNGAPIGQRNTTGNVWNSLAETDRPDDLAVSQPEFLRVSTSLLQPTGNVLAIQVVESSVTDNNLLLGVNLIGLGEVSETSFFFEEPTPGRANVSSRFQVVSEVQFSHEHGFYDQVIDLELSTPTDGAAVYYTTDGSVPTEDSLRYAEPIRIGSTTNVRAIAIKEGLESSRPVTQSYLYVADVINQSATQLRSRGFPSDWGPNTTSPSVDYGMDRRVAGQNGTDIFGGLYADRMREDLLAVPTLSLTMEFDDLFGVKGIYGDVTGRGVEWERPTSVELIHPDGTEGFQVDAGIRIQGGIARFISSKMSLRLLFKEEYGFSKLEYPLFGDDAASVFDSVSLRSSSGEHLVGIHYIRDEFARRSQLATGNVASHGTYMHVYINGAYWGLYNPVERPDAQFTANYYGGEKDDWDVLNAGDLNAEGISPIAGSIEAWNAMVELSANVARASTEEERTQAYLRLKGLNADGTRNPEWEVMLDTDNYIDYLITQIFVRNADWPIRNYYMAREQGADSTGFKFFVWDAEFTLDRGNRVSLEGLGREGPGIVYDNIKSSEAFRVEFSDRVQQHFSEGGAFYVNPNDRTFDPEDPESNVPASRYNDLGNELFNLLGPEAARWGDEVARPTLFVPHEEWRNTFQTNLESFFPNRARDLVNDFRRIDHYNDPPTFSMPTGRVDAGQGITISAQNGDVYFTLDGTDPRLPDGSIDPNAIRFTTPLTIDSRTTITTRGFNNGEWSAIDTVYYYIDAAPATAGALVISELNFNPHDPIVVLGEPEDADNNDFEFVELLNVSDESLDLTGVQFGQEGEGIEFQFGAQSLAPGRRIVVPHNREAFIARYGEPTNLAIGMGDDPSTWQYTGRLGNGGETITLSSLLNGTIQTLTYDDGPAWPQRADGNGSSLELIDPSGDVTDPGNYRSSIDFGGSPGRPGREDAGQVRINEVMSNPGENQLDQFELANADERYLDVGGWFVTDNPQQPYRFQIAASTTLYGNGYLTYDDQAFGFGLNSEGEALYLIASDDQGRPSWFADAVYFAGSEAGTSLGRWPDAEDALMRPLETPTFGSRNAQPRLDDVIITEVMYLPEDPDAEGPLNDESFEYLELTNRSDATVDLTGWKLSGHVEFDFPVGTQLEAGASLLVSTFDGQANPVTLLSFQLTFGSPTGLRVLGPWDGSLLDSGAAVQLLKPLDLAEAPDAMIYVDGVDFKPMSPWPEVEIDHSIHRADERAFTGVNWNADEPSPGTVHYLGPIPGDLTGDGQVDIDDVNLTCSAINGEPVARADMNGDGEHDHEDLRFLIEGLLRTNFGDANLDGRFDSRDLVATFAAGTYETDAPATWATGDWNCDGVFTSRDLVVAMIAGGYRSDVAAAAEPVARSTKVASTAPRAALVETPGILHERLIAAALDAIEQDVADTKDRWLESIAQA